jgi:hypothetical protein
LERHGVIDPEEQEEWLGYWRALAGEMNRWQRRKLKKPGAK